MLWPAFHFHSVLSIFVNLWPIWCMLWPIWFVTDIVVSLFVEGGACATAQWHNGLASPSLFTSSIARRCVVASCHSVEGRGREDGAINCQLM